MAPKAQVHGRALPSASGITPIVPTTVQNKACSARATAPVAACGRTRASLADTARSVSNCTPLPEHSNPPEYRTQQGSQLILPNRFVQQDVSFSPRRDQTLGCGIASEDDCRYLSPGESTDEVDGLGPGAAAAQLVIRDDQVWNSGKPIQLFQHLLGRDALYRSITPIRKEK